MTAEARTWTTAPRQVPILATVDVVVVGGGYPGVCAAVGAARAGARVALIERDGMLGGQAAEIYTFGLDGFIDRNGKQFVAGIPWEVMRRTLAEGQSDPTWDLVDYARLERDGVEAELSRCGLPTESLFVSSTYVNPNAFRYVLHSMAEEAGVTTYLESPLIDVMRDGNRITGVVAGGDYGPFAVEAKVVVDTSPHAAVTALAGTPFPHPLVYLGTHPRVVNIDVQALLGYVKDHPDDVHVHWEGPAEHDGLADLVARGISVHLTGFAQAKAKAIAADPAFEIVGVDSGTTMFFYDRDGCGSYWVHSGEPFGLSDLDDPLDMSQTVSHYRRKQWLTHKLFREYVPGFRNAHLVDVHPHVARALQQSTDPSDMTEVHVPWEHMVEGGNAYADSIARVMGHPDTEKAPQGWQFPYRALLPTAFEGLLLTGKPACRKLHYHGTNAAVGHAAGVAAAIAARDGVTPSDVNVPQVQEELGRQGAIVF